MIALAVKLRAENGDAGGKARHQHGEEIKQRSGRTDCGQSSFALRIADEFNLDMTLEHCTEGYLIPEVLKKAGRGARKPYCINESCSNFTPEEKRGGYVKKAAAESADEAAEKKPAAKKTATKKTAEKKTTKTAAKKTTTRKKKEEE